MYRYQRITEITRKQKETVLKSQWLIKIKKIYKIVEI